MRIREALIVTGTINVGATPYVAIKDPKERLLQYLCSLVSWIKLTTVETIIFCENSNTSYDFTKLIEHSYCDALSKRDFQVMLEEPIIIGRSGSNGALVQDLDYDDNIKSLAKNFIIN